MFAITEINGRRVEALGGRFHETIGANDDDLEGRPLQGVLLLGPGGQVERVGPPFVGVADDL